MKFLFKRNKQDENFSINSNKNCAERIVKDSSDSLSSLENDEAFIDYKLVFNEINNTSNINNSVTLNTSESSDINISNTLVESSDNISENLIDLAIDDTLENSINLNEDINLENSINLDENINSKNSIDSDDSDIKNFESNNKLLRGYIPYTSDIKPNTNCTDLTVTNSSKLILATQIATRTIRISLKSVLISISLTILNLFI